MEAARNDVFAKFDESYDNLRWYCEAIVIKNPRSVVCLEVNDVTKSVRTCICSIQSVY